MKLFAMSFFRKTDFLKTSIQKKKKRSCTKNKINLK